MAFLTTLDDVFTPDRCLRFINHFEQCDDTVKVDSGLARYERAVLIDAALAAEVFAKVRHLVPPRFKVVCANDHFRFSKYVEGEEFKMHRDGINQDSGGNRSVVTVNIFLNASFTGGSTDFFFDDRRTLRLSVTPLAGRAAVFDSQQYHCGTPVTHGCKFLLRTDLMAIPDGIDIGSPFQGVDVKRMEFGP